MKRKKTEDFLNQPRTKIRFLIGTFSLAFLLLISVYYIAVINPLSVKAFSGDGAGEAGDPYQISNCDQLQEIGAAPDKSYILVNDINCSSAWLTLPEGYNPPQFFGTLDGRNHKIIGLAINRPTGDSVGLFATIDPGAVVKNLSLTYDTNDSTRAEIVGKRVVGAVAAWSRGTIENVHSELNVKSADTQTAYIGGLVGKNIGTISRSSSTGNVAVAVSGTAGRYVEAGGLVGWSEPEGETGYGAGVSDSYATGKVTTQPEDSSNYSYAICGGLIGHLRGGHIIQRSYSMGDVTCESQSGRRVGGLIGLIDQIDQTAVRDSYTMSNVRIGEDVAGGRGLVGFTESPIDLSSNYFDAFAVGSTECSYSPSTELTCQAVNSNGFTPDYIYQQDLPMANWDFDNVWLLDYYGSVPLVHRTVSVTPDPPVNLTVTRDLDNNQFQLTWEAPVSNEGRADNITDYIIEYRRTDGASWQVFADGESTSTSANATGLDLAYGYDFKIRAVNSVGNGIFSEIESVAPTAPSIAPGNLSGVGRTRSIDLTWDAVPTATTYDIRFRKVGTELWKWSNETNSTVSASSASLLTLESSTNYEIQVLAKNVTGSGPWSDLIQVSTTAPQSYSITTCQQLQDMKNDLSGNYSLARDIDCSDTTDWNGGQGFEPIGGFPNAFNGTFDGNGHTVTGLTIKRNIVQDQIEGAAAGIGLFGVIAEGTVRNITLDNPVIESFATYSPAADQNQDGIADNVILPQSLDELKNYSGGDAFQAVLGLSGKVAMGPVAGMVLSSGAEYKNIHVKNAVGVGNTMGGVFGVVIHASVVENAYDDFTQWQSLKKPFIMDDITSTGYLNGGAVGGLAVVIASGADGTLGEQGRLVVRNSWSSADVNAIIGGGLAGATLSAGSIVPIAVMSAQSTPENPVNTGQIYSTVGSAISTQAITLDNVHASGEVSACDNIAGLNIGALGGLVGLGFGTSIRNSYTTGEINTCISDSEIYGVENGPSFTGAGGVMGGLGSILLASNIENSYSTSQINIKRGDQESAVQNRFNISGGILGGLAGVFATGTNEQNKYAVLNSYASGNITVDGGEGSIVIGGGLFGTYLGSGTINNSYATGNVTHNSPQSAVVNVSLSGGLVGLGVGVDVPYILQTVMGSATPNRTQGILVYNSYATGSVLTNKEGGGLGIAASGGLMGVFVGSGEIVSSHATGSAGVFPASEKWNIEPSRNFPINTDTNASISGGLIGISAGIDTPLIVSMLANGGQGSSAAQTNGINIDSSYAKGNVRGFVAGGLIGYGDMLMRINKTYAEGNVNGNIIGGLMGASGIGGTAGSVFVGMFASSALSQTQLSNEACTDDPRSCALKLTAAVLSQLNRATGPITISNTYTTSNLTTTAPSFKVNQNETGFKISQTPVPAIAGGLVGFYATPGGSILNTYASGDITITPRAERAAVSQDAVRPPAIPNFAGGLFGVHVAMPLPDFEKIANYNTTGLPAEQVAIKFNELLVDRSKVENVFTASKLTVQSSTQAGSVAGLFGSPLNGVFGDAVVDKSKIFNFSNVYADKTRIQVEECSAVDDPYRLIIDSMEDLYVPNGQGGNAIPNEANLSDNYKQIFRENVGSAVKRLNCNYVNKEGNDSNYFKNNKVNSPLNFWDFNKVWVVQTDDYPKFVAGASTTNPINPPVPTITTPANVPAQPSDPDQGSRVLRRLLAPSEKVAFGSSPDSFLKRLLQRVPPLLAKSIPYLIILMLLLLAARYGRQALKAYREQSFYHKSMLRVASTKAAINDYLAITTHYLNTPAAIMASALELLGGSNKLPAADIKGLQSKVKSYAEMSGRLLSMNQVSASASVTPQKATRKKLPNPLRQKEVYIPLLIATGLLALANALFIYADIYNRSAFRVAIEFTYLILSGGLVVMAYRYRSFMEMNKDIAKQQLHVEAEFYGKRQEFIKHAAVVTHDNHLMLDIASKKLKKVPEARLFFNGLGMLGSISRGLNNIDKFSDFSNNPPLLDISASTTKAVRQIFYEASKRNIKLDTHIRRGIATQITPEEYSQIISSLLDNALKFGKDNGKIWVSLYRKYNRIVLVVSDDGEGISKEKLPSLLKPFSRATDSMEYNHQGIGLSLYANKLIVNKYGGSIKIDSEFGNGTDVTVMLPLQHGDGSRISVLVKPDTIAENISTRGKDAGKTKK